LDDYGELAGQHSRASEAAWAEHHRLLERASASSLRKAAEAHNSAPTWLRLGVVQRAAVAHAARRTPAARPAAHRPAARAAARTGSSSASAGADPPQDESDESEPGSPGRTFERFRELTAELAPTERVALALALPNLEASMWADLADQCAAEIDRELAEARR